MNAERLPPGQQFAAPGKWPIVGERDPAPEPTDWSVSITGLVHTPRTWSLAELRQMTQESRAMDIHCVTRWTMLNANFRGVPLATLLEASKPKPEARFISFVAHSPRQHSTSLPLQDALQLGVLLALEFAGEPIIAAHGGPVRSVTPKRYFYKSLKWLTRIELLSEDRLGYWEASAGYHNHADPWEEERYIASGISKQAAAQLFANRDISGRELLGLDGADRDLTGLQARGAILRNANFRRAQLTGANFARANLSNAHLEGAILRDASLAGADVEGANFVGCDLRGADLRGASLFGTSFIDPDRPNESAILDETTRIDSSAMETLLPQQAQFVANSSVRSV